MGLLLARGDIAAALLALASAGLLAVIIARLMPRGSRLPLAIIVGLAFTGRLALAALLHEALEARGQAGLFGDDAEYPIVAWAIARYIHGESGAIDWYGYAYIMSSFLFIQAALFSVIGLQVTFAKVLNVLIASVLVIVVYDATLRLFGRRAALLAAALVAFFPSVVLWSVLDLKDMFVVLLITSIAWATLRFIRSEDRWTSAIVLVVALVLLESTRRYLFWIFVILIPLAVIVASYPRRRDRVAYGSAAALAAFTLWTASVNGWLGPAFFPDAKVREAFANSSLISRQFTLPSVPVTLDAIERERSFLALGARTAYGVSSDSVLAGRPGDQYVIQDPNPAASPVSGASRIVLVTPGTRIVVETASPPPATRPSATPTPVSTSASSPAQTADAVMTPTATPSAITVRPGDVIVVAGEGSPVPKPLALKPGTRSIEIVDPGPPTAGAAAMRLLGHLPTGVLYALAAPFPWQAATRADIVTIPEMLAWYLVLIAAIIGTWTSRRRWRELFIVVAAAAGVFAVLAVAEGNAGTLFRHRAMLYPFVLILASPVLGASLDSFRGLKARIARS
jgi:hypothetical protein